MEAWVPGSTTRQHLCQSIGKKVQSSILNNIITFFNQWTHHRLRQCALGGKSNSISNISIMAWGKQSSKSKIVNFMNCKINWISNSVCHRKQLNNGARKSKKVFAYINSRGSKANPPIFFNVGSCAKNSNFWT